MIYNISGQQPFQVLADSFSVSPSESGYNLYLSADGVNYSQFAAVASGVTRQFTGMNNGNYYILSGNTSDVQVNWNRDCRGGGGGAAGVSSLDGQTGALTTKTINGNAILGEGDIVISGGTGGPTVINLDALSQAELVELYNTLSGQTTASTVNIDYVFLKSFSAVHGDNQVPFKVQFIGLYTNKVRFYVPKGTTGHNGEIWNLYAEINSSGAIETSMQVNYGWQGLRRGDFSDSFYYNVDTEEFKLGSTTLSSGVTYEGIFDKNYYDNIYNGNGDGLNNQLYLSYYKLHITGSTVEETYTCPILSKKAVASTTIDGQTFNTRFFFDYGEYVLSFLVNTSGYKANPEIKYRANVVQISQSDYDALVAGGTVDSKTVYVII